MVEWGIQPELLQQGLEALGLLSIGLGMAFRKNIRHEVKERQEGTCDCCGEFVGIQNLQTHHRVPESLGGASSRIQNAVGVCQDCHRQLDEEAFRGVIYPQVHDDDKYYPQGNGL